MNYTSDRFANPGNTVTLPRFTTLDAMAAYCLAGLDLQLNVTNLLDQKYIASGHGSSPNLILSGAPRSVQLRARYVF